MAVSESLRVAIRGAMARGTTRYVISREAGVAPSGLSRFLAEGRDVRASTVDAIAEFRGPELAPKKAETGAE